MPDSGRDRLVALMQQTLADETAHHTWTYDMIRPLTPPASWKPGQPVIGDCSKGVQYLCRWAGVFDPMGNNWSGWGNSQTIWAHLQHADTPGELHPGDIVTFGFNGDEHATMVLEQGSDPLLWSFGHQGAPDSYRLSQDGRPAQFCKMPLPYVPTPRERLKAMTGWFAWMAWSLGEGDWRKYGKRTKNVRPNVPALIPLSWWIRRARFMLNRKRGNAGTR